MGYFKNELIAQQVEEGDRVPEPKPATEHVALRQQNISGWRLHVTMRRSEYIAAQLGLGIGMLVAGFILGVVL